MGEAPAGKVDLKRALDSYRARSGEFRILDVPPAAYLMVDGHGDPNTSPEYAAALQALYPVAYALKSASQAAGRDYVVPPLEGLWWSADMDAFTVARDKAAWDWTLMLLVPEWLGEAEVAAALAAVAGRRAQGAKGAKGAKGTQGVPERLGDVRYASLAEGRCVQTLHVGPFDAEGPVLEQMHRRFIPEHGLELAGTHHEVYLSDPRRTAPERLRTILRTILRQPVRAVQAVRVAESGVHAPAGLDASERADLEERIAALLADRLADRLATRLAGRPAEAGEARVERRRMFGHRGFMVGGKLAITAGADGLLVRVDPARSAELLARPGARQAVMGEKDMGPSWLTVAADAVESDAALADWVEVALDYNRVLTSG